MSYVAIYALSGKKIIGQKFACVNFLTNIMSAGVSDIIARVSFLVFSHYLANIVYRDIKAIS